MNAKSEYVKILLWACIEDYAGLWEFSWELNGKFPSLLESEQKRISLEILNLLLENGFIQLYRCQEPYGELFNLDADDSKAALAEDKNWIAPEKESESIRVGATEKGEQMYRSGNFDFK